MGVRIDKPGKHKPPAEIDNLRITRCLFDFVARTDDVDLAVANKQSAVANDSKRGQFIANARTLRARQRDELSRVKKSERLQVSLLCTIWSIFLNSDSESACSLRTFFCRSDLNFSSFKPARLIRTFNAAPSTHARVAQTPTPTSEIEFGFPFSAISASNSYDFDAVSITFSGIAAAYFVADSTAAARDAFSSADCFGNANASITLLKAAVSSSTSSSNSSLSCCAFTAHLLKYSSLSSQPRLPAERFATIPPSDAPSAPINAATDPPPGAGESLKVSLQNSRRFIFTSDFESLSIFNSITFSFGSKCFSSLSPIERTAISISSSSEAPSDHFCFRKK